MRGLLVSLVMVTAMAGCSKTGGMDASRVEGDGEFAITGTNFINKGYAYSFEEFPLAEAHTATYTFESLPDISKDLDFGVNVIGDYSIPHDEVLADAHLQIRLLDDLGNVIFDATAPISEWWMAESSNHARFYSGGDEDTHIAAETYSDETAYTVELIWSPSPTAHTEASGQLKIECGGYY